LDGADPSLATLDSLIDRNDVDGAHILVVALDSIQTGANFPQLLLTLAMENLPLPFPTLVMVLLFFTPELSLAMGRST